MKDEMTKEFSLKDVKTEIEIEIEENDLSTENVKTEKHYDFYGFNTEEVFDSVQANFNFKCKFECTFRILRESMEMGKNTFKKKAKLTLKKKRKVLKTFCDKVFNKGLLTLILIKFFSVHL